MITAIVPAQNEESRIETVINHLLFIGIKDIFIVINGCTDNTEDLIKTKYPFVNRITFSNPLGIDLPKAIGAFYALKSSFSDLLFFDGDLTGEITTELSVLIKNHVKYSNDLTLTDCYPEPNSLDDLPKGLLFPRMHLNQILGIYNKIGIATPSHGPYIVSNKFLNSIELKDLAIPPVLLARCVKKSFKVGIGANIPHVRLGSKLKNGSHTKLIYETLWGDCAEAISFYLNLPRNRFLFGHEYQGYNPMRRFDILESLLQKNKDFNLDK